MGSKNSIDIGKKIAAVLKWSDTNENFDNTFVLSLGEFHSKYNKLTQRQEDALENIIDRFGINWEDYLEDEDYGPEYEGDDSFEVE